MVESCCCLFGKGVILWTINDWGFNGHGEKVNGSEADEGAG